MTTLVVGASGATGRLLVEQLLDEGQKVRIIVRAPAKLPENLRNRTNLEVRFGSILDLSDAELEGLVEGCEAVASCLGHNLTLNGVFGKPRRLVTDAVRRLCTAVKNSQANGRIKFVLMNSSGVRNRDISEPISLGQQFVIGLLRLLVPPHADNESAAEYLRSQVGQDNAAIAWVAVRPDSLTDEDEVTEYEVYPSPIRSAIFDAGATSRINVANFMVDLITNPDTWERWEGQMPVIYNQA
jgi:nucleoside-diphosphate-sugar epimerase